MKTHLQFSLALLAALTVGMAATAMAANQSTPDSRKFYMAVVAERTDQAAKPALPTPDHPAYYVAYDAGYIEAGDPIGGEEPAPAAAVAQALRATLASQNYLPASAPSLLIVYHWGVIRPDSHQIRDTFNIQPNLKARIALVSPSRQAGEIENYLLEQRMGRIHRYGQEKDCLIFNFVASNTREGRVMEKLFERIQQIEKCICALADTLVYCISELLVWHILDR